MLIQCQHCQSTYTIDEKKIPDQNAFVRCANCTKPISLNRQDQTTLTQQQPKKVVACANCGTRYSIPLQGLKKDLMTVRCGKCGHTFQITKSSTAPPENSQAAETRSNRPHDTTSTIVIQEEPNLDPGDSDIDLDSITIPEENEIEVDLLFDDMDEPETPISDTESPLDFDTVVTEPGDLPEDSELNSTEAYLDSVRLSTAATDDAIEGDAEIVTIDPDEKYKLFLKPRASRRNEGEPTKSKADGWPDIQDDTDTPDLEEQVDAFTELDELGSLPDSADEAVDVGLELQPIPENKRRGKFLLAALILAVLLGVGGVAGWLHYRGELPITASTRSASAPAGRVSILDPISGRLVDAQAGRSRRFVLEGYIRSDYPEGVTVNSVEVIGILYDSANEVISEVKSFAGPHLTPAQLADWSKERITSYLAEYEARRDSSLALGGGQTVPFQIIFFDVPREIQKLEARIDRHRLIP
jgi:predicted Zn finger-like uncharacterized protein